MAMRLPVTSVTVLVVLSAVAARGEERESFCARIDSIGDAELRSIVVGFANGLEFAGFTARRVAHGYASGEAGRDGSEVEPAAAREGALVVAQVIYRFAGVAERLGDELVATKVRATCRRQPGLKASVVFPKVLGELTDDEDAAAGARKALKPLE